jgi:hypothetical protein
MFGLGFKRIITNQKGIGIISIIILMAVVYASLTFYAYLYPSFNLAKYTPVNFLSIYRDDERKEELKQIADALDSYYDEERNLPGGEGFCSRIFSVLHPAVKNALSPYFPDGIPQDPVQGGTHKDYFYLREDRDTYVLLAVLDNPPTDETYNYEGCHDWPGDDVYNYIVTNE